MASGRRGGPPDLKSTLGSLLRTTLEQASAVREVVEQQTRQRGGLLDHALTQRRRSAALAKLGKQVYRLAKRGELGELLLEPEISLIIGDLEQLDAEGEEGDYGPLAGPEAVTSADYVAQSHRGSEPGSGDGEYRVWRPVMPEGATIAGDEEEFLERESDAAETAEASAPTRSSRLPRRSALRRGGGIHFSEDSPRPEDVDSDEDLASYMHDDDVPEE
ncbi:MAG: hypothetical protein GY811_31320 [Myxococcales bacterium]|nr:hypothetical protein [Myxococcales bacterium]